VTSPPKKSVRTKEPLATGTASSGQTFETVLDERSAAPGASRMRAPQKPPGSGDYEVGYSRPPAQRRFRKGVSGNPGGRPAGSSIARAKALVLKEVYRRVTVREGDKVFRMPALQAVLRQSRRKRRHVATKPQLLTRDQLDGRTGAAKVFDRLVRDIEIDLGGREQLSTIELQLIEVFAGACVALHNLNTRLARGEQIDLSEQALAASCMVRIAARLGLQRRAKEVAGETFGDLLRADLQRAGDAP
jgi:hypothetical protein